MADVYPRIRLQDYDISRLMGFVPEVRLEKLPEYFCPWERICENIPEMIRNGTIRSEINKLPLLEPNKLLSIEEWKRAYLVLTDLASSYVWCEGEDGAVGANCNWRKIGPNESDIELINSFTGTKSEEGFFKSAICVELAFGKGGPQAVIDDNEKELYNALIVLKNVIHNVTKTFLKVHELCDPQKFYCLLRPFLAGWGEGSPLAQGLVYEGITEHPMKYSGASAAQCSVFQAIDGFFGINHTTTSGDEHYLNKMRQHMPTKHRAFIAAIENGPSVKKYVKLKKDLTLIEAYNQCVEEMQEFRSVHIRVVTKYIISQANKYSRKTKEKLADHGTGGSDLLPFLKAIRSKTAQAKIQGK